MIKLVAVFFVNLFLVTWAIPLIPFKEPYVLPEGYAIGRNASDYRLPTTTIPLEYTIVLTANPNEDMFKGQTTIRIRCMSDTNQVVLHANQLNVTSRTVRDLSGSVIGILYINQTSDDRHFYTITLNRTLSKDQIYDLAFEYNAPFGPGLNGLYKSSYRMSNGTIRNLAFTQFQPTHARQVFPCYDEPGFKAVFTIHVHAPNDYRTISNMDTVPTNQTPIDGYNVTSFRSTPLMSTYLVAIVISDFEYKSNVKDGEIIYPREYRVYARPTAQDTMDYSLDFGQRSFQAMQTYTDVNYRLPKIDNIAVPDFTFGAMENWGLITYREEYLLFIKGISSTRAEMTISIYMSHENAHFWFGNEVTPKWWDYTWLNEGFATFFEIYASDKVYDGKGGFDEYFVVNDMQDVMIQDSLPTTNSMTVTVGSPTEIIRNFNSITYVKSGSVIRMIQHVLGDSVFRLALSSYLKNIPTGLADPQMLYSEMQKVVAQTNVLPADVTVAQIFGSWSDQAGYPFIRVDQLNNTTLSIVQRRFYQNSNITSNQTWWIPLTWTTHEDPDFSNTTTQAWMTSSMLNITLQTSGMLKWFIFNKQQCGYYRVMYSSDMWEKLADAMSALNHSNIHTLNRAQLIDDAGMFSRTGLLNYNITLRLLNALAQENDWYPWTSANRIISFLNTRMPASEKYDRYTRFISSISNQPFKTIGGILQEKDDFITRRKRPLFMRLACDSGAYDCLAAARNSLNDLLQTKGASIDPDLKPVIYCSGLREASKSVWDQTFSKYENETETERLLIINGLGCSQNDTIIDSYLNMTISNQNRLRRQDIDVAIRSVISSGPFGVGKVLEFLWNNFLILKTFLPNAQSSSNLIESLGNVISKDEQIELFKNFTMKYSKDFTDPEKMAVSNAEAKIVAVNDWKSKHIKDIDAWLEDNVKGGGQIIKQSILLAIMYSFYILVFKT